MAKNTGRIPLSIKRKLASGLESAEKAIAQKNWPKAREILLPLASETMPHHNNRLYKTVMMRLVPTLLACEDNKQAETWALRYTQGISADDHQRVAHAYGWLLQALLAQEKYKEALPFFARVINAYEILENHGYLNAQWANYAMVLKYLGQNEEASDAFKKALQGYETLGDEAACASIQRLLGELYEVMGEGALAEQAYKNSLELAQKTKQWTLELQATQAFAHLMRMRGDVALAASHLKDIADAARAHEKAPEYMAIQLALAQNLERAGQNAEAKNLLVDLQKKSEDTHQGLHFAARLSLASMRLQREHKNEVEQEWAAIAKYADEKGDTAMAMAVRLNQAQAALETSAWQEAEALLYEVEEHVLRGASAAMQAPLAMHRGLLASRHKKDIDEALALLRRGRDAYRDNGDYHHTALANNALYGLRHALGENIEAYVQSLPALLDEALQRGNRELYRAQALFVFKYDAGNADSDSAAALETMLAKDFNHEEHALLAIDFNLACAKRALVLQNLERSEKCLQKAWERAQSMDYHWRLARCAALGVELANAQKNEAASEAYRKKWEDCIQTHALNGRLLRWK